LRTSKGEAALAELDEAIRLRPTDPELFNTRAWMRAEGGDRAGARDDYERTVDLEGASSRSNRLASAHVELAHLCHQEEQYDDALDHCVAALAAQPQYAAAHRQRAETLLALSRYREAGQALDAYLAAGGRREANMLEARGLIHYRLGEYPRAVELFTRALDQRRDANVLTYRGWAYLDQLAVRLAEADFEAALKLQEGHTDALCGRGLARARLGQTAGAAEDAEAALRSGPRTAQLLFNCACIHARCFEVLTVVRRPYEASARQQRALNLLTGALALVPQSDRPKYWRDRCQKDPDLRPLQGTTDWLALARNYAR
jgi:tetratricopeptide (TPR) repeat protein